MTPCRWARQGVGDLHRVAQGLVQRERALLEALGQRLPSRYSMTRKATPSCSPMSCRVQMWGWLRREMARASRSKRSTRLGASDEAEDRTLMATARSSRVSRAR